MVPYHETPSVLADKRIIHIVLLLFILIQAYTRKMYVHCDGLVSTTRRQRA